MVALIVLFLISIACLASGDCLDEEKIKSLSKPVSCKNLGRLIAKNEHLPQNCHTQGIDLEDDNLIVTCMDRGNSPKSRVLFFDGTGQKKDRPLQNMVVGLDRQLVHPSAFQIREAKFPVAFAKNVNNGNSDVQFFSVAGDRLPNVLRADMHVGALAYSKLFNAEFVLGCGWDCNDFRVWKRQTTEWETLTSQKTQHLVANGSIDNQVGNYNSLSLQRRCNDDKPLLFASHGSWMDLWEVDGLEASGDDIKLKKIWKRLFQRPKLDVLAQPLFHEGMSIEIKEKVQFIAAPDDFTSAGCPAGTKCIKETFVCEFN